MDSQTTFGSSSDTSRRGWWSRPIVTIPASNDRDPTFKESAVVYSPLLAGLSTTVAIFLILSFIDKAHPHPKFSIQSVAVSHSTATCHVDFLVKNPSSRYSIYYDTGDASLRLGHINIDVFNVTRKRNYRDHTAFSLDFTAGEVNGTDVGSRELHIKLGGKHKRCVACDEAGHFDVICQNLTRSHENTKKIKCQSYFTRLQKFV